MAEAPDPLFDVSEPALSNRIDRFKLRLSQSPLDHAMQSLAVAVDDVNAALWCAGSPEAQSEVTKLSVTISVALTMQRHGL